MRKISEGQVTEGIKRSRKEINEKGMEREAKGKETKGI